MIDPEKIATIKAHYEAGKGSFRELASEFGVHFTSIQQWAELDKWEKGKNRTEIIQAQANLMLQAFIDDGFTKKEVRELIVEGCRATIAVRIKGGESEEIDGKEAKQDDLIMERPDMMARHKFIDMFLKMTGQSLPEKGDLVIDAFESAILSIIKLFGCFPPLCV